MMPVVFSNGSYSECDTYDAGKFLLICRGANIETGISLFTLILSNKIAGANTNKIYSLFSFAGGTSMIMKT